MQETYQLAKQQLKDQYFLQRHQLLKKHEKVESVCPGESPNRVLKHPAASYSLQ